VTYHRVGLRRKLYGSRLYRAQHLKCYGAAVVAALGLWPDATIHDRPLGLVTIMVQVPPPWDDRTSITLPLLARPVATGASEYGGPRCQRNVERSLQTIWADAFDAKIRRAPAAARDFIMAYLQSRRQMRAGYTPPGFNDQLNRLLNEYIMMPSDDQNYIVNHV